MNTIDGKLTLSRPVTYQIKVQGHLGSNWRDEGVEVSTSAQSEGIQVSMLLCLVDQAALHGLLRRLYTQGFPLISVICVDTGGNTLPTTLESVNSN